jgi:hypothetical protein
MFPSTLGLPESLNYKLPPSLSDAATSTSIAVQPDGITVVSGPQQAFSFVANVPTTNQFNAQVVSFTIPTPSSNNPSIFLDPKDTTLSFSLTYTISTAATAATATCNLISSAASFIDTLVLYSNSQPLETINAYGLLQNYLLQNTVSLSEKVGGISVAMGSDNNSATGLDLAYGTAGTYRYNFCIPLISIIGINSDKLIPISAIDNLQLQLTTASIAPVVTMCSAVTTNVAFSAGFSLVDWNLNLKYVNIGEMAANMLKQTLVDGKWFIKSASYLQSAVTMPTGSSGNQGLLMQLRGSSVKSIFQQFGINTSTVSPNNYYDAINIGCTQRNLQVGSQFFPSKALVDTTQPAVSYSYLIQALGGSIAKNYGSAIFSNSYNSVGGIAAVPAGSDTRLVLPAVSSGVVTRAAFTNDGNAANGNVILYPSGFFCGYDLERVGGTLFSGINTRTSAPYVNCNLGSALSATVQCNAWAYCDVILAFDVNSKTVQAFI